jgi:hypothetical protein
VEQKQSFKILDSIGQQIGHKGIKTILQERDLWNASLKLPAARNLLAAQPDFARSAKRNWVMETIENLGHLCIMGVKFHPELAVIEYYWGETKRFTRANCDYSLEGLRATVPQALHSVPISTIRRQYAHVQRYMKAYRMNNLSLRQVEWAMRKYNSHRRASTLDLSQQNSWILLSALMISLLKCPFQLS